ncbi:hypothetical protein SSPO_075480 [Streptomyces antimycoticus]|uniref:Uncharacterized protein n=1 Tax=Streptomyces antimycoticus TaxID=68175 RepID=A0A499UVZ8_9ACTN|nr:hypothetical protein SSPO_075480 [Streptomyces antimycoticus]
MSPAWAAETSPHSAAQPAAPSRARKTARGVDSSMNAPPRTGVRRRTVRPGSGSSLRTARSTPKSGRTPARSHARANRTAPARLSRSVSAIASIPRSAARCASRSGCAAPYRMENPDAVCRCVKPGIRTSRCSHP